MPKKAAVYERRSRFTGKQQGKLIDNFVAGTTARTAAELVGVQPNTAIRFFHASAQIDREQTSQQ